MKYIISNTLSHTRKNQFITSLCTGLILSLSVMVSGQVKAATASTSMTVTTTVIQSCKINSVSNMAFGLYSPFNNATIPLDTTNTLSVSCVAGSTGVSIAFDEGLNKSSGSTCSVPLRRLTNATNSDYLSYDIYLDASRTQVQGCASGINTRDFTSSYFTSTSPVTLTQYGRIFAGQDPKNGAYTDTVNVTVSF